MATKRTRLSLGLTACRTALGHTQADFAAWAGFSTATIVRWETGMRSPPRMAQRHLLVHRVASKRPDLAAPLAEAMDVELLPGAPVPLPATDASSTAAAPSPIAINPRDLLVSIYAAAERLEIPAGRFRPVLADLVAQWSAARWETAGIAKALAEGAPAVGASGPSTKRR